MLGTLLKDIRNFIRRLLFKARAKYCKWYRKGWLFWPLKFIWVNYKYVLRTLNYPFADYKKLNQTNRGLGIIAPFLFVLITMFIVGKLTHTEKIPYVKRTYASYDCDVEFLPLTTIGVGERTSLGFNLPCYPDIPMNLMVKGGYGVLVLKDTIANGKLNFELPKAIIQKTGVYEFSLIYGEKELKKFTAEVVTNDDNINFIESYFGPRIILAGGRDYTMLTVAPTDSFDNPMPNGTQIKVNENFKEVQKSHQLEIKDFTAFKRFYSYNQTGKITVSMQSQNGVTTKEKTTDVYPFTPQDFSISHTKEHSYSDGNEVVTFRTSQLKDIYGNVLQNGTMVHFLINTESGKKLAAYAKTVKGIATTKVQHPYEADSWEVQAFVPGLAESNIITIDFKSITIDLPINFKASNRRLIVGPIKSYMGQLVPNGTAVSLHIKGENKDETKVQYTVDGKTEFILRDFYYPNGVYQMNIKALGIQKNKLKKLTDE